MTERSTPATYQRSPRRGREDDGRDPCRAHADPRTPRDDNDERQDTNPNPKVRKAAQ